MLMMACSIYFVLIGLFYIHLYLKDRNRNRITYIILYLIAGYGFYTQKDYHFPTVFNIVVTIMLIFGVAMRISRILKKQY